MEIDRPCHPASRPKPFNRAHHAQSHTPRTMGSATITPARHILGPVECGLTLTYTAGSSYRRHRQLKISGDARHAKPQFTEPASRTSTRSKPAWRQLEVWFDVQHPDVCEHAADPRRPRLSAPRRHVDGSLRRPPQGLAGRAHADQCREARRIEDFGRCICNVRVLRTAGAAGVRPRARRGSRLEGDPALPRDQGRAIPACACREDMGGIPRHRPEVSLHLAADPH